MGGSKTVYFKEYPRRDHTEETLRIARERADELGIDTILVSTRVGDSAVRATEVFRGKRVIAGGAERPEPKDDRGQRWRRPVGSPRLVRG